MKHTQKPTLTVAMPAYNEEKNISGILKTVLSQNQKIIKLKNIVVYSDGSNDKTINIVKKIQKNHPAVKIVEGKKRRGKMYRMNQIFSDCRSDILILFDADVKLVGPNFLDNLSQEIIKDPKANLVVSHAVPFCPKDLIGKILHATYIMWDYVRLSIPHFDHVQNFYPAAAAYRGSFARALRFPPQATEDRIYIYLMAKKTNSFRYTFKTTVNYWAVTTMREFINLSHRSFGSRQSELEKIFGKQVNTIHIIPLKYKIIGILKSFLHQPLYTPAAIFLGFLLSKLTAKKKAPSTGLWEISTASKKATSK